MNLVEYLRQPWPWYVAGPLIGLAVPALLLLGNKRLGVSASLRHICAATIPAGIPYFRYNWKKEIWNLVFVAGILVGAFVATALLTDPSPVHINPKLTAELTSLGIKDFSGLMPQDLFGWPVLLTLRGLTFTVVGGFLVGFGTRYAGGCTSGHAIMGLSNLQWPSLVATCSFMAGGFIMTNFILPILLHL